MGKSILVLVLAVIFVQINASLPNDEHHHHHERNKPENKRPATGGHHREHRSRAHGTDTVEKTKPCEQEATNGGHWEWIPNIPRNSPYMIQPPTMQPMYPFFPMPMWPPPGMPAFLPAPVQLPSTTQPHDQTSGNLLEEQTTSERKPHKRSHEHSKNHEPRHPKHTQSTVQHKKSEVEIDDKPHDRNKNDQKKMNPKRSHTTHHRTAEDKINEKNIVDSRGDHPSVDSKRTHPTNKTVEDKMKINQNPSGSTRNDESVNRQPHIHSKVDSETGNEDGNIELVPDSRAHTAKTVPLNAEKFEQKSLPTPRKFSGTQTTRV